MTQSSTLSIPRSLYETLLAETYASPHAEICGLLAGHDLIVTRHVPIPNCAPNPATAYTMEPQALVRSLYAIYTQREQLVAIYHSHPNGNTIPSPTDIAQATYPEAMYIIIAGKQMAGWFIRSNRLVSVVIEIVL